MASRPERTDKKATGAKAASKSLKAKKIACSVRCIDQEKMKSIVAFSRYLFLNQYFLNQSPLSTGDRVKQINQLRCFHL